MEQRRDVRIFARHAATVVFDGKQPVNCVIWDMSNGGARLAIALRLPDLPNWFTLNFFADGIVQKKNCEVVWADNRFVGVKFTEPAP